MVGEKRRTFLFGREFKIIKKKNLILNVCKIEFFLLHRVVKLCLFAIQVEAKNSFTVTSDLISDVKFKKEIHFNVRINILINIIDIWIGTLKPFVTHPVWKGLIQMFAGLHRTSLSLNQNDQRGYFWCLS